MAATLCIRREGAFQSKKQEKIDIFSERADMKRVSYALSFFSFSYGILRFTFSD